MMEKIPKFDLVIKILFYYFTEDTSYNMTCLFQELTWLQAVVNHRQQNSCPTSSGEALPFPVPPPLDSGPYADFVHAHQLSAPERLLLMAAISPYLQPDLWPTLNLKGNPARLIQHAATGTMLPTGETFLYLMAGNDAAARLTYHHYLGTRHLFYRRGIIDLGEVPPGYPSSLGLLQLQSTYRDLFLYGQFTRPRHNQGFPAHLLETELEWEDLVLNSGTGRQMQELRSYLQHESRLRDEFGLGQHMKPGYRVLFHGPSGTGKTFAAALLGKMLDREVYRVDLSLVVSKYIGETSKNLNALFQAAADKDWILFFDEGDALFSKRVDTNISPNSSATYANQDVAFLLQRIENFNGLIVVATNFRRNLDHAFTRRFQSIVHFDIPGSENAVRLWRENAPTGLPYAAAINLEQISMRHQLSAASILKIIQRATLRTIVAGESEIGAGTLNQCIRDEEYNNK